MVAAGRSEPAVTTITLWRQVTLIIKLWFQNSRKNFAFVLRIKLCAAEQLDWFHIALIIIICVNSHSNTCWGQIECRDWSDTFSGRIFMLRFCDSVKPVCLFVTDSRKTSKFNVMYEWPSYRWLAVWGVGLRLFDRWDRWFESRWEHERWCLVLLCVV